MKRDDPPSATPMSDRLAALTDNYRRARPHHTPEMHYASAWGDLKLAQRDQVRAEETGEFQRQQAENEARVRAAVGKLNDAAAELRKAHPELSKSQAFSRVYQDPANAELAKAERETSRAQIGMLQTGAGPSGALVALNKLAAELRGQHPELSRSQAFAKVYSARENSHLVAAERAENRPVAT